MKHIPDPIDKHIGARIRMRRLQCGISQEKLAEGLGLTFQQVQKYEKAANRVGGSRMAQIAALLQVEVGYFYQGAPLPEAPANASPPAADTALTDFMASSEGLVIARAFCAIPDPKIRRIVAGAVAKIGRALAPKAVILKAAE